MASTWTHRHILQYDDNMHADNKCIIASVIPKQKVADVEVGTAMMLMNLDESQLDERLGMLQKKQAKQ